jgi:hypothetical protein
MNGSPYSVASPAFTGFANTHLLRMRVELVVILLVVFRNASVF